MKCQLIKENCIACGLCQLSAPNIFDYDDFESVVQFKDMPEVNEINISKNDEPSVIAAYRSCPTKAIHLIKNVVDGD